MSVNKVNKSYFDITGNRLKTTSQLKMFPIFEDTENKFLNIFRNFNFRELNVNYFITHPLDYEDRWDLLSYKYYETPYLWWTIPLVNNIENPFEMPQEGVNVKILKYDYVYSILNEIKNLGSI